MLQKSLIILYTPFHQIVAFELLNQSGGSDSIIIDHNKKPNKLLLDFTYHHIGGSPSRKLFGLIKYRTLLKSIIKKHNIDRILIPHTDGILSNFCFQYANSLNVKIDLFYEGILALYNFKRNTKIHPVLTKKLTAILLLFKFKAYDNIFPAEDLRIDKVHTPFKDITICPDKKKHIFQLGNFSFKSINSSEALFLSQPMQHFTSEERNNILKKLIEILNLNKINKLVIKKHPKENSYQLFEDVLKKEFELEILDNKIAIEKLTNKIAPSLVVSLTSSAIINLMNANQDVKFYSIYPSERIKDAQDEILKAFEHLGVKIILS